MAVPFIAAEDFEEKLYKYLLMFEEFGRKKVCSILRIHPTTTADGMSSQDPSPGTLTQKSSE